MTDTREKSITLTIRMTKETKSRLDQAMAFGVYKLTATQIVERGIELALQEIETKQ